MNLYLCEFSVHEGTQRPSAYKEAVDAVLAFCADNRIHCWRSEVHDDYAKIEQRINSSEIFVAIIDKYWKSSTWKGHEFIYSGGAPSIVDGANGKIISNRIVFVFDGEFPAYLRGGPAPITIVHSIAELRDAFTNARQA
jgi:hypothetical protein